MVKSSLTIRQLNGKLVLKFILPIVYFAHAYSPHECGSNENLNRVLRRFIPKGQAIEELSDRQLVQINKRLSSACEQTKRRQPIGYRPALSN